MWTTDAPPSCLESNDRLSGPTGVRALPPRRSRSSRANLLAERAAIARILAELGPSFRDTRAALNELARVVGGGP